MDDNPSFEEQQPIQTAISLHQDYFQITPQPEEPSVEFYGDFDIDSCYVSSKLPLGYIICWHEDILAGLECFRSHDSFAYNTKEWENILLGMIQEYQGRLSASVYSGLPKRLRLKIWLYMARVYEIRQRKLENEIRYHKLRVQPCADAGLVDKDVVRSFGNISFFQSNGKRNLQSLSNILYAYANYDPDVGYTQGLNFLGGMLLLLMSSEKEENNKSLGQQKGEKRRRKTIDERNDCEEEAFWMLVYIMQEKNWRLMFLDDTPKLLEMLDELEEEMKERAPKVYECLTKLNCIAACFSQYFLTVYLFSTPYEFAKRMLEIFLIGGHKVLIHVTIKVLMLIEDDLFEMNSIEEILPFLKTDLIQFAMSRYPSQFAKFLAEQPV